MEISKIKDLFKQYEVIDIATDSRFVIPGSAFFAVSGRSYNGNAFIADALSAGAVIVFSEIYEDHKKNIYSVKDIKKILVYALKILYPILPDNIVAITGTNGKTSVAYFFYQILSKLGYNVASIGTLGVLSSISCNNSCHLTTPDITNFYKILSNLKKFGVNYVAFEASSIGLDQGRMDGINICSTALTNIGVDHLDYHGSMENYIAAKKLLFGKYGYNSPIITNVESKQHLQEFSNRIIVIGEDIKFQFNSLNSTVNLIYKDKKYYFITKLLTDFQVHNLIISMLLIESCGIEIKTLLGVLSDISTPPGRLEKVSNKPDIFVDFAHNPESLELVLKLLRKSAYRQLVVVFGCGGNRDKGKRILMGKIADQYSDVQIITDDNPRNEDPNIIRKMIMRTAPKSLDIADRKEAIHYAIKILQEEDVLLVAGKGHEKYQIIGDQILPFDDVKVIREILYEGNME